MPGRRRVVALLLGGGILCAAIEGGRTAATNETRLAEATTLESPFGSQVWQTEGEEVPRRRQHDDDSVEDFDILQQLKFEAAQRAGGKKKKKKKKKKRKKPQQKPGKRKKKPPSVVGQPAQVIFAQLPQRHPETTTTTQRPATANPTVPLHKIKYIWRKTNAFKRKKKEYLGHLKQVLYPFVKFVAFFSILNPFTLGVFLFTLVSPVVFGFLGFAALSFLVKPALHLLFDVKQRVSLIKQKRWRDAQRRKRLRHSRRPITIHKHYYVKQQGGPGPHHKAPSLHDRHNPLLPHVKAKLRSEELDGFSDSEGVLRKRFQRGPPFRLAA